MLPDCLASAVVLIGKVGSIDTSRFDKHVDIAELEDAPLFASVGVWISTLLKVVLRDDDVA